MHETPSPSTGLPSRWALGVAAITAAAVVLMLAPPVLRAQALLGLYLNERSVWILALSLLTTVLLYRSAGRGLVWWLSLIVAVGSAAVFLRPPLQAFSIAKREGLTLSWSRFVHSRVDEGPVAPAPVSHVFATVDGRELSLDVYGPGGKAASRAIVVLHGGGWSAGDKGELPFTSAYLAQQGLVVVDAQYRLDPAPNWRIAVGDVKCAVAWVRANAVKLGVDPNRITLLGRSAGGHLALVAAYAAEEGSLPSSCGTGDARVDSVVALYAPIDLVWGHANPSHPGVYDGTARLERFLGGSPQTVPDSYAQASPLTHVKPGVPATLLIHGGTDAFVSARHVAFLTPKLDAAGVRYRVVKIPYAEHGFDNIFGGWSGQLAEGAVLKFLSATVPSGR
ncbi:MAG: alpha/beta hydrolase fold domain-containing protein [Myxococcaceae bacterium]